MKYCVIGMSAFLVAFYFFLENVAPPYKDVESNTILIMQKEGCIRTGFIRDSQDNPEGIYNCRGNLRLYSEIRSQAYQATKSPYEKWKDK